MEVCAHFNGRKVGFFSGDKWQLHASGAQDFSGTAFLRSRRTSAASALKKVSNAEGRRGSQRSLSLLRNFGEAVTEGVDDQLEPVGDVEFVKH